MPKLGLQRVSSLIETRIRMTFAFQLCKELKWYCITLCPLIQLMYAIWYKTFFWKRINSHFQFAGGKNTSKNKVSLSQCRFIAPQISQGLISSWIAKKRLREFIHIPYCLYFVNVTSPCVDHLLSQLISQSLLRKIPNCSDFSHMYLSFECLLALLIWNSFLFILI